MVFSSLVFLFLFFPTVIIFYFLVPSIKGKNLILLLASLFFYAWGEPIWVILLLFSGGMDFLHGKIINHFRGQWQSKLALIMSISINLFVLGFFKYGNFLAENLNLFLGDFFPTHSFSLPIGISFYTFQTLSYTIDVYRNKVSVQKSYLSFQLYVSMFPQLVAGPIVRYGDIDTMFDLRSTTVDDFYEGAFRFICGLGKKVLLANYAYQVYSDVLVGNLSKITVSQGWLGLLMYTYFIYFDFSGYSDMAIGLGRIFGFRYPENFSYPYFSLSITDFWRRWHISLGNFFRDYVYIPLKGNREHQIRNIAVVWFLTGLWHGANWNFIIWGGYFGVLLILEKYFLAEIRSRVPVFLRWLGTFLFVMIGWGIFSFDEILKLNQETMNFHHLMSMFEFFQILFGFSDRPVFDYLSLLLIFQKSFFILLCFLCSTPLFCHFIQKTKNNFYGYFVQISFTAALTFLSIVSLLSDTYNVFLYFKF